MKYKVGDKVVLIRNPELGSTILNCIDTLRDRVATIKRVRLDVHLYDLEEVSWGWKESQIEGLVKPEKLLDLTTTRFGLMDFE